MLISCPKCNAVYDITGKFITSKGKKFKCAECEKIWTVYPDDVRPLEPDNIVKSQKIAPLEADDVAAMFNRLSQGTEKLFIENKSSENQSFWARNYRKMQVMFTPVISIFCLFFLFVFLAGIISYVNRYEITGIAPKMENFYHKLGLESVYNGKNIVFQNVEINRKTINGNTMIEIVGSLHNEGRILSRLLPLKAIIKNEKGQIEQEVFMNLTTQQLEPQFSTLFYTDVPLKTAGHKNITLQLVK